MSVSQHAEYQGPDTATPKQNAALMLSVTPVFVTALLTIQDNVRPWIRH